MKANILTQSDGGGKYDLPAFTGCSCVPCNFFIVTKNADTASVSDTSAWVIIYKSFMLYGFRCQYNRFDDKENSLISS